MVRDLPPDLFDWEVREGTLGRIEDALLALGGVAYDMPLDGALLVDRTLATEAVGDDELPSPADLRSAASGRGGPPAASSPGPGGSARPPRAARWGRIGP